MKRKFNTYIHFVCLLACTVFFVMCSKTEFLPDPEGEKMPYQPDATQTVEEILSASSAKLFYSAWQKSTIKTVLAEKGSKVTFTVLAPNDVAMEAAGMNSAVINQMTAEEMDEFVLFYVSIGLTTQDELKFRQDNFMVNSLLQRPDIFVKYYSSGHPARSNDPYFYRNYLAIQGDQLLVNGKSRGAINYTPATNGAIYLLEKAVEKPTKTILEALESDERFTMFLAALKASDDYYVDKIASDMEPLFGYKPEPEEIIASYGYLRNFYASDWSIRSAGSTGFENANITLTTIFAPTNEAFHKAGFQTVEDIEAFNLRRSSILYSDMTYSPEGGISMDTIFTFHRDFGRMFQPQTVGGDKSVANASTFYSNDLKPSLNDYFISAGGNPSSEFAYKMPLAFSLTGSTVELKVKESTYPAAKVIEGDINTLNGPIHVIDQLLVPNGFKLN